MALKAFAIRSEALFVVLENYESEAGLFLEFLGTVASFRDDGGDARASLALPQAEIKKLVEFAGEMASQDFASVGAPQRLAGRLRFTQTAITGRFGRAALKPFYELIAKEGSHSALCQGLPPAAGFRAFRRCP